MCRPSHSSMKLLLLSQQLCLKSTKFSQLLGLLRALLVKQGYFLPFGDKYILDELGFSSMLLVFIKRLQHGANRSFATVECMPSTALHSMSLKSL